jgi:hypothetical protein
MERFFHGNDIRNTRKLYSIKQGGPSINPQKTLPQKVGLCADDCERDVYGRSSLD